jgi:predicted aldo/keto reductase-like oxidoreductase
MDKNNKAIGRRSFLARSLSGMAAAGILGRLHKDSKHVKGSPGTFENDDKILYRTLGNTGLRMPIVNMGVMNTRDSALVRRSYEKGVRHFDTAAHYQRGQNEIMLGQVVKDMGIRDKVIIGTKVFLPGDQRTQSPKEVKNLFIKITNESLKRLQTDYIDILYSHNVKTTEYLNHPGVIEALHALKDQKKTRFIGFTTHTNMTSCIDSAIQTNHFDVILTVYNYALANDIKLINVLKKAAKQGIGLIAMKTQCVQYWYREYVPDSSQKYYEGKIMHTAVLKWALNNNIITSAVPGYTTFQQLEEDFSVSKNLQYTPEEKKFLEDRDVKLSLGYCTQCQSCLNSCPKGVDVPSLMRTHLYALCYANVYQARDTLESTSHQLELCKQCDSCTARCNQSVPIGNRIEDLKILYT